MMLPSSNVARAVIASLAIAAATAAGCGGGGGGGTGVPAPMPQPSASAIPAVNIVLFARNVGSITSPTFGLVQGFTQQADSQVLGLSPGQQIMLVNGDNKTHTFNVYSTYPTPPPPPNGTLDTTSSGTSTLDVGYRSGPIAPGGRVGPLTVTNNTGDLFIACAFHFGSNGMQDGIVVNVGATPGPQASVPAGGGGTPPPCHGPYC
jgi:hypothetical protein